MRIAFCSSLLVLVCCASLFAQATPKSATSRGDQQVAAYFERETQRIEDSYLADIKTLDDWNAKKDEYRRQLFDMLGLDPQPPRTDLHATTTGKVEHDEFIVENVHFQSRPQLYVTGNLYLPKGLEKGKKIPAILYVCGHGGVKKDGISYGNKVHYQHHGAWYARHGYACLVIDSLQLGEIEALHHGLHRENMWWWPAQGYTPAGVEAWNCIRALDYLQSRPEIDGEKLGATGRSGGGAYSWWIAALDERIKAAVPVAGITDLRNHIVDGCISGHCDCMYMNNTYEWDYPLVAALVAPRPLVISNTDRDPIFPLDGVYRTFLGARRIYELHKAADKIAFNITAGGHVDTPELQMQAFRWFDHHLQGVDRPISKPAEKFFQPEQLKVFKTLPTDQINTKIQDQFVPLAAAPTVPADKAAWDKQRDTWMTNLKERVFRGWPTDAKPVAPVLKSTDTRDNLVMRRFQFETQEDYPLDLYVVHKEGLKKPDLVLVNVFDQPQWEESLATLGSKFDKAFADVKRPPANEAGFHEIEQSLTNSNVAFVLFAPRGYGPTQWSQDPKTLTHLRRRFILLGQTHEGQAAWDVRRAVQAVRTLDGFQDASLGLRSEGPMAGVTLAASLFEPKIARLDLIELPASLQAGPYLFNAQRYLDTPALVAMAAERARIVLHGDETSAWEYPQQVAKQLGWVPQQLNLRKLSGK